MLNKQKKFTKELANEIINLNNNTISKQEELITEFKKLGETFKELNSGVSGLLKWQENYKETIESNTKELNLVLESIHNTDESIKSIAKNSSLIKENNENLSKALKDIRSSQEVIVDGTKSIIQISDKAQETTNNNNPLPGFKIGNDGNSKQQDTQISMRDAIASHIQSQIQK